ncbi:MAG: hypothetical protein RR962_04210 [Hafnia sp.]
MRVVSKKLIKTMTCFFMVISSIYIFSKWPPRNELSDKDDYQCQSAFKLVTPELSMPVVSGISVKNDKGVATFGGPVYKDNVFIGTIRRRIEFNYESDFGDSIFKVTKTIKFERDNVDDKTAEDILPGFITKPNADIYFKTVKIKSGILFFRDNAPMFFCQYY